MKHLFAVSVAVVVVLGLAGFISAQNKLVPNVPDINQPPVGQVQGGFAVPMPYPAPPWIPGALPPG